MVHQPVDNTPSAFAYLPFGQGHRGPTPDGGPFTLSNSYATIMDEATGNILRFSAPVPYTGRLRGRDGTFHVEAIGNGEVSHAARALRYTIPGATHYSSMSGCTPTTTAPQFDGGYRVSMCYRTPQGEEGQARSGIWASGQAGLLWFFDRGNAEVLVKVLDGCAHNGHRWVFVAPVTDLEFNLWITGPNGQRWTHSNTQGITASTKSDTSAFRCS